MQLCARSLFLFYFFCSCWALFAEDLTSTIPLEITGDVEIVSFASKEEYTVMCANYRGDIVVRLSNSTFQPVSSQGTHPVTSGIIMLVKEENGEYIIDWHARIAATNYRGDLNIQNIKFSKSGELFIVKVQTDISSITLTSSNGEAKSFSDVIDPLGIVVASITQSGLFSSYKKLPHPCKGIGCTPIPLNTQTAIEKDKMVAISSISSLSEALEISSIVLHQVLAFPITPDVFASSNNMKDTNILNTLYYWTVEGEQEHYSLQGASISLNTQEVFVSGTLQTNSEITVRSFNGTDLLVVSGLLDHSSSFLLAFSFDPILLGTDNSIRLIWHAPVELGDQEMINQENLSILSHTSLTSGFQSFYLTSSSIDTIDTIPLIIESENGNVQFDQITSDPFGNLFLAGTSTGSITLNTNTTVSIGNYESIMFIVKASARGDIMGTIFSFANSSSLSFGDLHIGNNGIIMVCFSYKESIMLNGTVMEAGSVLQSFDPCRDTCDAIGSFCTIENDESKCICQAGYSQVADQCFLESCPNDCSGHGTCSQTYATCECEAGYAPPDCASQIGFPSFEDFLSLEATFIGNIYQTTEGDIECVDYASLPEVGWSFVVGTFQGKAVFGDVSTGDLVTQTIVTEEDERASFIFLYSEHMHLQWILIARTELPASQLVITSCYIQPITNDLFITGYLLGDTQLESISFSHSSSDIQSLHIDLTIEEGNVPQFFARITYMGQVNWFEKAPSCRTTSDCIWRADHSPPLLSIVQDQLVCASVSLHVATEGSGAADRENFMVLRYDLSVPTPILVKSGFIGDCTYTSLGESRITGMAVLDNNIVLAGHLYSNIAHFHDINNQSINHPIQSLSSPAAFLVVYDLDFHFLSSRINEAALAPSLSLGIANDINQVYIWSACLELNSQSMDTSEVMYHASRLVMDVDGSSLLFLSDVSIISMKEEDWESQQYNVADMAIDNAGDLLFCLVHPAFSSFDIYYQNEVSHSITIQAPEETSYHITKFTRDGTPLWTMPIQLVRKSNQLQVADFQLHTLYHVRFDESGKIRLLGSLKEDSVAPFTLTIGVVASLDGLLCEGCNQDGWCYLDGIWKGVCMCDVSSDGAQCTQSILLPFQNYLSWGRAAQSLSSNGTMEFYGLGMDVEYPILYTTGYQRGDAIFSPFLTESLHSIPPVHLGYRYGDGVVASISSESGDLFWVAYAKMEHNNQSSIITELEVERYDGYLFVVGWAEEGTLQFYHASPSIGTDQEILFQNTIIPHGGSPFIGTLAKNGTWIWADRIVPSGACTTLCPIIYEGSISKRDFFVDIELYQTRQFGGIDLYVTGTYLSSSGLYDSFIRRYNILSVTSRPHAVWDIVGTSGMRQSGMRGGTTISILQDSGDVIAGGYWSAPIFEIEDLSHQPRQLESLFASDPSIRLRWSVRITRDGLILWMRSNDLPASSVITESTIYDSAISTNGEIAWLCINDNHYTVNSTTGLPNRLYSSKVGSVSLESSSGYDYLDEAVALPIQEEGNTLQPDDLIFYSTVIDPLDNIISGGYYSKSGLFSALTFVPTANMQASKGSQEALLSSWDRYGNLQYLIQSHYGISSIHSVFSDLQGNLFVSGASQGHAFFDGTLLLKPTTFLFRFSACPSNCNEHGVCIFGAYGTQGKCSCNTGWYGETCDLPICSGDPVCAGRGTCVSPEVCECEPGFASPSCAECADGFQPPSCTHCTTGLVLPDCTECNSAHLAPPYCIDCYDGWVPPLCNTCASGYLLPECKVCQSGYKEPNCIDCMEGYYANGNTCISTCENTHYAPPNCDTCIEPYSLPDCRCMHGYMGNNCEQYTCIEIDDCGEYGICMGPNECYCEEGYSGRECTLPPDYSVIHVLFTNDDVISASPYQAILIDASPSYDQFSPTAILTFQWDCIDTTFPDQPCPIQGDKISTNSRQLIPAYYLVSGHTYIWKVTVHSTSDHSASNSLHLVLDTNISVPSISIHIDPEGDLFSAATILVTATSSRPIYDWNWVSLDHKLDDIGSVLSPPSSDLASTFEIPAQSVEGDISLYVEGRSNEEDPGLFGSAVTSFSVIPTSGGYCSLIPSSHGESITTRFLGNCYGWGDPSITYSWLYRDINNIPVVSTPISDHPGYFYVPNSSPTQVEAIIWLRGEWQATFPLSLANSLYVEDSLTINDVEERLSMANEVAMKWPSEEISVGALCSEPICALNVLSSFSYVPSMFNENPNELPSAQVIYDIMFPLFYNPALINDPSFLPIFSSILHTLSIREDIDELLIIDIAESFLELSLRLGDIELSQLSDWFTTDILLDIHKEILLSLNYWTVHRLADISSISLRILMRQIIDTLQHSLARPLYLSCGDDALIINASNIIIAVSRGSIDDLKTSVRISLSSHAATFRFPDDIESMLDIGDDNCFYWHRGVYPALLYEPTESLRCIQAVTSLTILSADGETEQIVQCNDDNPIRITFPIEAGCYGTHDTPHCVYNADPTTSLLWSEGDCILQTRTSTKLQYTCSHLTDFTLETNSDSPLYPLSPISPNSPVSPGSPLSPISPNSPVSPGFLLSPGSSVGKSSIFSVESSPLSSMDDIEASSFSMIQSSEENSDGNGVGLVWVVFSILISIVSGGLFVCLMVGVLFALISCYKRRKASLYQDFSIEMDEFNLDEDMGGLEPLDEDGIGNTEQVRPHTTVWGRICNALASMSTPSFFSRKNVSTDNASPLMDVSEILIPPEEKEEEMEESVFVFSHSKDKEKIEGKSSATPLRKLARNEESSSSFIDPDDEQIIANPIQLDDIEDPESIRLVVDIEDIKPPFLRNNKNQ